MDREDGVHHFDTKKAGVRYIASYVVGETGQEAGKVISSQVCRTRCGLY